MWHVWVWHPWDKAFKILNGSPCLSSYTRYLNTCFNVQASYQALSFRVLNCPRWSSPYSDATWASWCLKSLENREFVQQLVWINNKDRSKLLRGIRRRPVKLGIYHSYHCPDICNIALCWTLWYWMSIAITRRRIIRVRLSRKTSALIKSGRWTMDDWTAAWTDESELPGLGTRWKNMW